MSFHKLVLNLAALLLFGLLLSACTASKPLPINPVEAQKTVFEVVTSNRSPETVASYTVLGSQASFQGHVIAYWMCRPAAPNSSAVSISGYAVVRKYPGGNGIQSKEDERGLPADGSLVEFFADYTNVDNEKKYLIFGRILSPEVQAVEVVYADEQRLRWPAGGTGFLLFRQEPVDWTRFNVLGDNQQVLKSYDLAKETTTHSERGEGQRVNCPHQQ